MAGSVEDLRCAFQEQKRHEGGYQELVRSVQEAIDKGVLPPFSSESFVRSYKAWLRCKKELDSKKE